MIVDAKAARRERQLRLKRLMLVGSAGSLALFMAVIAAQDAVNVDPPTSVTIVQGQSQDSPAIHPQRPRIRTRTS